MWCHRDRHRPSTDHLSPSHFSGAWEDILRGRGSGPGWPNWSSFESINDCSALTSALVSALCCLHVIWAVKGLTEHGAEMALCFGPLCGKVVSTQLWYAHQKMCMTLCVGRTWWVECGRRKPLWDKDELSYWTRFISCASPAVMHTSGNMYDTLCGSYLAV